jgi:hypothetical protein
MDLSKIDSSKAVRLFTTENHRTPPNTTKLLKTTIERIQTITEHLKVTTEHFFFITANRGLLTRKLYFELIIRSFIDLIKEK